jgi:hypothetical protein
VTEDYKDRCSLLYYDIVKENAFLTTKVLLLKIVTAVVLNQKTSQNSTYTGSAKRGLCFCGCCTINMKEEVKKVVEPEVANKRGA